MIELDHDGSIAITIFENEYKTTPIQNVETSISRLYTILSNPKIGPKKSNSCFVGGQVYPTRNNKNTLNRTILTFDFDDIPGDIQLFDHITERFMFGFAIYSTHNHSAECNRYRLVIPLDKSYELTPNEYRAVIQKIAFDVLETPFIDPASEVLSQVMFLPTCDDPATYEFYYIDEELLSLGNILEQIETIAEAADTQKYDSDYWREVLKGKSEGGRNQSAAQLSGHLLRRYIDPYVAYDIVCMWNERNDPPLPQKELDTTFNSILRTEMQRRAGDKIIMSQEPKLHQK
ncbi:primase alpha helix C-terminal domain-containing protein [Macrococcus brunensis]|uniref:primase alpha helix C-terminal domain-containing protein n=1 Tax=Macrococcus brunensis TaxID=198483 RepID=UPI001EF01031|nr:primase alpha helix C-terminal domain-containing protein [Macrococcus brunensis]ULG73193.1 primase alpha helix C-terminal domain-containing protein [Macrococcus brunensis]